MSDSRGKRRDKIDNIYWDGVIRDLFSQGVAASKIAKQTGKSYVHVKKIINQIYEEEGKDNE